MTSVAVKVSLGDIQLPKKETLEPAGWYGLVLCRVESLKWCDGLPTGDKHDEESVHECAKRARFDPAEYLVVVVNHEGKAVAIYSGGEKIA